MPRDPRAQAESLTQMTEYVLPQHANALGGVFGGQIMAWIDLCAAICAEAWITAAFRTSMEIQVLVEGEDATTGRRWPCVNALVTFVAIDADRKPTDVPPLLLDSESVRRSQAAGEARRASRLARLVKGRPPHDAG
jgi:acyl-CoA hydrolase